MSMKIKISLWQGFFSLKIKEFSRTGHGFRTQMSSAPGTQTPGASVDAPGTPAQAPPALQGALVSPGPV